MIDACVPLPHWREAHFLGRKLRELCLGCSNLRCDILASSSSLPAAHHSKHIRSATNTARGPRSRGTVFSFDLLILLLHHTK